MNLFNFVLYTILFLRHSVSLFLKQSSQFLIQLGQALGLLRILFDLAILIIALLSCFGQIRICFLLNTFEMADLIFKLGHIFLGVFLLTLHLQNLIFQLLVLQHEQFILSIKLRDPVQGTVNLDSKYFCGLFSFFTLRGRFF